MLSKRTHLQGSRPGVVLLVVISLLVLFASVGIAFVIYSQAQASTCRTSREAETMNRPDMDPEMLMAYYLNQLIYDTGNPGSALRGHSLARTLYGRPGSVVAFEGGGRSPGAAMDYTNYTGAARNPDADGMPNAPYTYPDHNNVFLAAVRGRDGAVLASSYHRIDQNGNPITLRPSASYHPNFPPMADAGGDVKNLADSPGFLIPGSKNFANNDSVWVDLGFPVMTAPDGTKFKPLFAALVNDLDNRVNVNTHGNLMEASLERVGPIQQGCYQNGRHMSTEGWGPWEVNIDKILSAPDGQHLYEGRRVFTGNQANGVAGRYDPEFWSAYVTGARLPVSNTLTASFLRIGQFYSRTDWESEWISKRPNEFGSSMWKLTNSSCFPSIPGWYANGSVGAEAGYHVLLYNFFDPAWSSYSGINPKRRDRAFAASDLEALLRYGDTGSPALTSDLFLIAPKSLGDPVTGRKARNLLTTHAFDVDQPGSLGQQRKCGPIDLNRRLPDYPGLNNQQITNQSGFNKAQKARQDLAMEIYNCLAEVTAGIAPPSRDSLRASAQIAVNIVDYIDNDDFMTPFQWAQSEYVFGNELPRLVVNEVYAEVANNPNDLTVANARQPYQVRFWVELHNPLTGNLKYDTHRARLVKTSGTDTSMYQLIIARKADENAKKLAEPSNTLGVVDPANVEIRINDYNATNGNPRKYVNRGQYYVIGPKEDFPGTNNGRPKATLRVKAKGKKNRMYYEVQNTKDPAEAAKETHTILLRRLACPFRPQQNDPAQPNYNPFVTVDYLEVRRPVNDAVKITINGDRLTAAAQQPPATVRNVDQRVSYGREQPYAAALVKDQRPNNALKNQPQHTMLKRNLPAPNNNRPYRWLTYMDRPLISPMELLQVARGKPHEQTQKFILRGAGGALQPFSHLIPWFDEDIPVDAAGKRTGTHGYYRLLAYLRANVLQQGVTTGGRAIGRININTIWDEETFQALADHYKHLYFNAADVQAMFARMYRSRTPGGSPQAGDRPFLGFDVPARVGVEETFLRADPGNPRRRLFEIDPTRRFANTGALYRHPYLQYQVMNKIYNNTTTRSNVFAVWLTVGFFEVLDDSNPARPPKLGREIGLDEGRNIRHRMFAVVDRSNMTIQPGQPGRAGARPFFMNTAQAVTSRGSATIRVPRVAGRYEDLDYEIRQGDQLVIDSGPNQEIITVTNVDLATNRITANFTRQHASGVPLTNVLNGLTNNTGATNINGVQLTDPRLTWMGNPGPQPRFDMRNPRYAGMVRYFSIIE